MTKRDYFRDTALSNDALLTEHENHFLRNVANCFHNHGRRDLHDTIRDILQVRISQPAIIQQLLSVRYLDKYAEEHAALHMLWIFERTGKGHVFYKDFHPASDQFLPNDFCHTFNQFPTNIIFYMQISLMFQPRAMFST
jgi:hypothetical protein